MMKPVLAALFLFFCSTMSYAAPALYIDKPQYDFGTINQGEKAEHVFEIENRGDGELVIEKLKPS